MSALAADTSRAAVADQFGDRIDPDRLVAAVHELGHALVFAAYGLEISAVRVHGRGSSAAGYTELSSQPATDAQARGALVGALAGRIADLRFCDEWGLPERPQRSCAGDMRIYRSERSGLRRDRVPGLSHAALQREARHQVSRHWSRIVRLAPRLALHGRIART